MLKQDIYPLDPQDSLSSSYTMVQVKSAHCRGLGSEDMGLVTEPPM